MKRIIIFTLVLLFIAGSVFAQQLKRGNHDGTGQGHEGPVTVRVSIDGNGKITRIVVRDHKDTDAFMTAAQSQIIPVMIEKQSADVDVIAGATGSSDGIKAAVKDALNKAR
jgi:uncharacterized protein with FMN-binding domain